MNNFQCILLTFFFVSVTSCTNVAFVQSYDGPRGVDFSKGTCVVNEISGPFSKEANLKLTSIVMENLRETGVSLTPIESLRSSTPDGSKIPKDISSGLIDSLGKYTRHYYLFTVNFGPMGKGSNKIYVKRTDFEDNIPGEASLDNEVSVEIIMFDIQSNKQIYKQEVTATEIVETNELSEKAESNVLITRSVENVAKNALVKGLKDLKKRSKKS